ncbi:MAG: porin [Methyloligellaceae bacterium]
MIGANKKRQFTATALAALAGIGMSGIALSSAYAGGDIGGNCCADLEERVAELEATTARKGNRKVSLRVSGQVNKAIMHWDDSVESDTYVVDNISSASRFRFDGNAKIRPGWSAGYVVELEFDDAESSVVSQSSDDGGGTANLVDLRLSYWWIKSDTYGTLSVGQQGHATYLVNWMDTSGTLIASTPDKRLVGGSLQFRNPNSSGGGLSGVAIATVANPYAEARGDVVKYETPTIHGFKLSAAWGEDDVADIALRFARKIGEFKVLASIGASESTDEGADYDQITGAVSLFHIPTGLNVSFAAGDRDTVATPTLDQTFYHVKAGLYRKYNALGATAIAFEYYSQDEHAAAGGEYEQWGVHLVQNIDAAAMQLYMTFSNHEYSTTAQPNYQDIDIFMAGGRIKF